MIIEIKIPSPGESVAEVEIAKWLVNDGDYVEKDQEIAEVESDKATLPLLAEESGVITIRAETGSAVSVGSVACTIDTEGSTNGSGGKKKTGTAKEKAEENGTAAAGVPAGKDDGGKPAGKDDDGDPSGKDDGGKQSGHDATVESAGKGRSSQTAGNLKLSPLARKLMEKEGLTIDDVIGGLARITKEDVQMVAGMKNKKSPAQITFTDVGDRPATGEGPASDEKPARDTGRQRMSMLRRKLSERLVAVKNETAMLTTFNEVDMSHIIDIRKKNQSAFTEKHGVKLGFMSFFVKAATLALEAYPTVNSYIDGEDMVTPNYHDIGIAVQAEKGLMVPVIRNAGTMTLAEIEKEILGLADKARKNRISIDDMTGGTFTITNGGVFGSLLSTPILNPPQSGILGMHNIVERPVAIDGRVEIRPMMYIALSYDHRIIDGRDSVSFLVRLKEIIENPLMMLSGGSDPMNALLNI
ncbi:MAG: 2-oxoglutarate dehydrogenase complex dihydrolipoyllysine-residue succinyltransferase [Marinilabiliales bacterium]|nr:MAG: 2-oxoglutarate dehydrogenase complex dihydrolipoyllysine-residue succinyltransferase [Marinilabiliales bacterium]